MNIRTALLISTALLVPGSALAGTGTITVKDSSNVVRTFDVVTDASNRFGSVQAVCDGTALAQCAAVKAASTAPLATDPGLVVAIRPDSTVTANAGTNLNTSLLALEAGGNLASLVTQLGAVTASPTANTIADRLKTINTTLGTPLQTGGAVVVADVRTTGQTINSATPNAAYTINLANAEAITSFSVGGLTASGATLTVEGSDDGGTTWFSVNGIAAGTGTLFSTLTTNQSFRINTAGRTNIRLRVSSTGSGTITIASNASSATGAVAISSPLPAGAAVIGIATTDQTTPGTTDLVHAKNCDTTTATTCATVKAGSTAPAAGNTAVITDTRPNSTIGGITTAALLQSNLVNGAGVVRQINVTFGASVSPNNGYVRLYDAGTGFAGCNSATGIIARAAINNGFALKVNRTYSSGLSICISGATSDTDTTATVANIAYDVEYQY